MQALGVGGRSACYAISQSYNLGMKKILSVLIIFLVAIGGIFLFQSYQQSEIENDDSLIGGDRTVGGCLASAGYGYSDAVGACVREWEMTPDIMEAARLAVGHVGEGYALTIVSFNSYEEEGAYDIFFERGEGRTLETVFIRNGEVVPALSDEMAEIVGLRFMQDVVAAAPLSSDIRVRERLYNSLSRTAREQVDEETLVRDITSFVSIQDVPDQGVRVEDLEIVSPETATLTLGLNYSSGQVFRAVHLIVEDGVWKIQRVSTPVVQ